ncbi:predicted protein [Naegleria gruberi]|uniref:Predicted protein n=1 Tax=Naegleria gruberi TaxID=5762 RepID=D2V382_NAEGR|nr:uncharacterized protein NAEGRDRAFT_63263 [Naegleria gruberi]EFC48589.1 predicted protein [Naegleria gruberi]|eukprot:XP_002681333.1 predicted protein [Naegleria gruberi strain NEG-M]
MTEQTHEELFNQNVCGNGLAFKKVVRELFNNRIVPATKNLQQVNPKMIILLDWASLAALPTETKYKYGDRFAEDTLLNNCIKFLTECPRLSNMSEIAKVFIKDPDCKDAFMGLEKLIFRVVHNAESKESSGFLGYSYKINGVDLVVTLECNLTLVMKVANERQSPSADSEAKKLINAF